jgi:hypothetical protein
VQHIQGYIGSHWTLPSGSTLRRIAPTATRATGKHTTMKNTPALLAILVAMAKEALGFIRSRWMPPLGKYYVQ